MLRGGWTLYLLVQQHCVVVLPSFGAEEGRLRNTHPGPGLSSHSRGLGLGHPEAAAMLS